MQHPLKHLTLSLALSLSALAASAQTTTAMDSDKSMKDHRASMEHQMDKRGNMNSDKMHAMMAKHQAELKAKLKLTPEQDGAWIAFTQAMKPMEKMNHMADMEAQRAEMTKLNTPERIDKMRAMRQQRMTEMQKAMDQRDDAIKTFYGNLKPDQMKIFDSEHTRMGSMHSMREMHERYGDTNSDQKAKPMKK